MSGCWRAEAGLLTTRISDGLKPSCPALRVMLRKDTLAVNGTVVSQIKKTLLTVDDERVVQLALEVLL